VQFNTAAQVSTPQLEKGHKCQGRSLALNPQGTPKILWSAEQKEFGKIMRRDLGKSDLGTFLLCSVILDHVSLCSLSSESTET